MLIASVKKLTSALLGAQAANAKPPLPQQTSAVAPAASGRDTTPGVVFDLSDAAWQAAAAASSGSSASAATAPSAPPPFLPAGMTIAAEIAAANAPAGTAAPAEARQPPAQASVAASSARAEVEADPDEEARARAFAIQAQDHGKLLSLAEQLAEAKTEPRIRLDAPAEDAASDGKPVAADA